MNIQARPLGLVVLPLLLMTGCASFLGGSKQAPPESIYTIHAAETGTNAESVKREQSVVVIPKPELPPGLNTERIALYLDQGQRLDYYADAKWSAPLDALLQDFLVEKARRQLPRKIVGTPDLAASARYKLAVKVTDFGPVYEEGPNRPPRLDVGMTVTVLALPSETVKAQFSVKKSMPSADNKLKEVTNGLENVLQAATDEALKKAAPYLG